MMRAPPPHPQVRGEPLPPDLCCIPLIYSLALNALLNAARDEAQELKYHELDLYGLQWSTEVSSH